MGYLTEERRGFLGGLFGGAGRGGAGSGGGSGGGAGSEAAARADIFLAINASTVELQVGLRIPAHLQVFTRVRHPRTGACSLVRHRAEPVHSRSSECRLVLDALIGTLALKSVSLTGQSTFQHCLWACCVRTFDSTPPQFLYWTVCRIWRRM